MLRTALLAFYDLHYYGHLDSSRHAQNKFFAESNIEIFQPKYFLWHVVALKDCNVAVSQHCFIIVDHKFSVKLSSGVYAAS